MLNGNGHTNAYNLLRIKIQEVFDFASATSQAFPALKEALDAGTVLPRPDYFGGDNSISMLQSQIATYEQNLSTYLFLASFSFFENYLKNMVLEICDNYNSSTLNKTQVKQLFSNPNLAQDKEKLKGAFDGRNIGQYLRHSNNLRNNNYLEADKAFDFFAKEMIKSYVKNLKAFEIPDFLKDYLLVDLPTNFKKDFSEYSSIRNKIAHGLNPPMQFIDMKKANKFFKKSAKSIDQQVVSNFFLPTNYIK